MIGFLADANHGILCFASQGGRIRMVLKEKGGSGDKKFPAAACIFYMTGNLCAADSRISDKAVGRDWNTAGIICSYFMEITSYLV